MSTWKQRFDAGVCALPYKNLVCGWPDEEHDDMTHGAYLRWCQSRMDGIIDRTPPYSNVPSEVTFPTFKGWRKAKRNEDGRGDLGFSTVECDLCGALPGDRYAVTALPDNPAENDDYVALEVCGDCLMFIANGEEPAE